MYQLKLRREVSTVGDLRKALETINDDAKLLVSSGGPVWVHIDTQQNRVCLNNYPLEDNYARNAFFGLDPGEEDK